MNTYDEDLENRITIALHERARALPELSVWPVTPAVHQPDEQPGRSGRRVMVGAVVVALAAAVAVVAADRTSSPSAVRVTSPSSTPQPAGDAPAPCPSIPAIGGITDPDTGLEAVCLPTPAPGFPLRRGPDEVAMQDGAQTAQFLVGVTPPTRTTGPNGTIVSTPTGPEASVFVARAGSFPTSAAGAPYPVTGTTTALGATATIVNVGDGQIGVLVTADGFDVAAYGQTGPDGVAVTPTQLVTLIDSLHGLPAN